MKGEEALRGRGNDMILLNEVFSIRTEKHCIDFLVEVLI